jgi:hypothetical protein
MWYMYISGTKQELLLIDYTKLAASTELAMNTDVCDQLWDGHYTQFG